MVVKKRTTMTAKERAKLLRMGYIIMDALEKGQFSDLNKVNRYFEDLLQDINNHKKMEQQRNEEW